jgi:lysophospholipase L1-like esterase
MKLKDYVILIGCSLFLGWTIVDSKPTVIEPTQDTLVIPPTVINVKDKTALFIGDSHTANHNSGWQLVLSKSVGFKMINASVGGKTTFWMLEQALYRVNDDVDYCFVYGGANDMYGNISPQTAIENIKGIARICRGHNVKCIVLTGFDPVKCTRTNNPNYANKYAIFQRILLNSDLDGAVVIDTRVVDRVDCWDGLCHMNQTGHKKIAEKVIKDLDFEKI